MTLSIGSATWNNNTWENGTPHNGTPTSGTQYIDPRCNVTHHNKKYCSKVKNVHCHYVVNSAEWHYNECLSAECPYYMIKNLDSVIDICS